MRRIPALRVAGAVAVAAAAVATVVGPHESRSLVADHPALAPDACPGLLAEVQDGEVVAGSGIPAGATRVSMCPWPQRNYRTVLAPRDALVTDVDGFAKELTSYEELGGGACPAVGGFSYQLAFEYPDHSVRLARGDTGGCGTVDVSGTARSSAQEAFESFQRRLADQRRTATPPAGTDNAMCLYPGTRRGNSVRVMQDLEHLVSARICVRYVFHADLDDDRVLSADELATIGPELPAGAVESGLACPERPKTPLLDVTFQAIDQWNGAVVVQLDSCLTTNGMGPGAALSEEAQAIVDRAVTDIRADEPPGLKR